MTWQQVFVRGSYKSAKQVVSQAEEKRSVELMFDFLLQPLNGQVAV